MVRKNSVSQGRGMLRPSTLRPLRPDRPEAFEGCGQWIHFRISLLGDFRDERSYVYLKGRPHESPKNRYFPIAAKDEPTSTDLYLHTTIIQRQVEPRQSCLSKDG